MAQQILSVLQVNEYIRTLMDGDSMLSGLAIRGEISNYKVYPSGHHYFTLKEEGSSLRCVLFRGNASKLRFQPDNGMKVIVMGRISVFPRDGAYQMYCTNLVPVGVGDLHAAFEQLKAKLANQGLFEPSHKKPIPQYPKVIGVVTSSAGAAVHDILRILNKRYPLVKVRLFPVRVQGVEAPAEIVDAIRYANEFALADLLIVGRGGGSIEDLWAFNDERVAYAIYESKIPVISAVGHEPDVTISDYVADLRAATPSNGAELAVPDQEALKQTLDSMLAAMETALIRQLKVCKQKLQMLSLSPTLKSPAGYLEQRKQGLDLLANRLNAAQNINIHSQKQRYLTSTAKLDALSPLKVLTRGYAMVQTGEGMVLRSVGQVSPCDRITVRISDGQIEASVLDVKENEA